MDQENIEILKLDFNALPSSLYQDLAELTPSKYRICLAGFHPNRISGVEVEGFAVLYEGSAVGLILFSILPSLRFAELHFFKIKEGASPSIALFLLKKLEERIKEMGSLVISYQYPTDEEDYQFYVNLLKDSNWKGDKPFSLYCRFIAKEFNPPWLKLNMTFPPGVEEFQWKELSLQEESRLKLQQAEGRFPLTISPFNHMAPSIEPLNSLGLRNKNEVIGWMITHRLNSDTIRYSAFYIHYGFEYQASAIQMLVDSIKMHKQAAIRYGEFELHIDQVDRSWFHFVQRRLIPYAEKVSYINQLWKAVI